LTPISLLWILLRKGVRYQEFGPQVSAKSQSRPARMIKELKKLGYRVEGGALPVGAQA